MTMIRAIFLAMAFLIPATATIAKAEDKAPAAEGEKTEKKAKKMKKEKKTEEKKEEAPAK